MPGLGHIVVVSKHMARGKPRAAARYEAPRAAACFSRRMGDRILPVLNLTAETRAALVLVVPAARLLRCSAAPLPRRHNCRARRACRSAKHKGLQYPRQAVMLQNLFNPSVVSTQLNVMHAFILHNSCTKLADSMHLACTALYSR